MSTDRIRLLVDFEIHEGKLAEFEAVAQQMVSVSEQEPGTLAYHFVLSADRKRCRLVEGYTDMSAIAAHFDGPAVTQYVPRIDSVRHSRPHGSLRLPWPACDRAGRRVRRRGLHRMAWIRPVGG